MKTPEQKLDDLFADNRSFPGKNSPLLDQDEIRNILDTGPSPQSTLKGVKTMICISAIVAAALGIFVSSYQDIQVQSHVMNQSRPVQSNPGKPSNNRELAPEARKEVPRTAVPTSSTMSNVDIRGSHLFELRDNELEALGISMAEDRSVKFYSPDSKGTISLIELGKKGTSYQFKVSESPSPQVFAFKYVRLITDDHGMQRLSSYPDDPDNTPAKASVFVANHENLSRSTVIEPSAENSFRERPASREEIAEFRKNSQREAERSGKINEYIRVNKLIPFLIRSGAGYSAEEAANKKWRPDLIVWCEPAPEFISALPERIRKELGSEFKLLEQIEEPQDIRTADAPVRGERYSDIWRTQSGAVSESIIAPNPVTNHLASLRFSLGEARSARVSLHSVEGKFMKELSAMQSYEKGAQSVVLNLEGVESGIYLVSIQTGNGEQVVQRLIVQ